MKVKCSSVLMLIKKLANSKSMFTFLITIVAAAINLALAGAKGSLLYLRTFSGFFLVVFSLGLSFLIVMFPHVKSPNLDCFNLMIRFENIS